MAPHLIGSCLHLLSNPALRRVTLIFPSLSKYPLQVGPLEPDLEEGLEVVQVTLVINQRIHWQRPEEGWAGHPGWRVVFYPKESV